MSIKILSPSFREYWNINPRRIWTCWLDPAFLYSRAMARYGYVDGEEVEYVGSHAYAPFNSAWFADTPSISITEWAYMTGRDNPAYESGIDVSSGFELMGYDLGLADRTLPWLVDPQNVWGWFEEDTKAFYAGSSEGYALASGEGYDGALGAAIYRAVADDLLNLDGGIGLLETQPYGAWPQGFKIDNKTGVFAILNERGEVTIIPQLAGEGQSIATIELILQTIQTGKFAMDPAGEVYIADNNAAGAGDAEPGFIASLGDQTMQRLRGQKPLIDFGKTYEFLFGEKLAPDTAETVSWWIKALLVLVTGYVGVRAYEAYKR
jgi:hypothetical protein